MSVEVGDEDGLLWLKNGRQGFFMPIEKFWQLPDDTVKVVIKASRSLIYP